jgi:hypothetical protein
MTRNKRARPLRAIVSRMFRCARERGRNFEFNKNREQAMQRITMQRLGKGPFQLALNGLLTAMLLIPVSGSAAGWTQGWAKIIGIQVMTSGFWIFMNPQGATNVNNCSNYLLNSGNLGESSAVFFMPYTNGVPTEAQRVIISQISLAEANGKPLLIYSAGCVSTTAPNSLDGVVLQPN